MSIKVLDVTLRDGGCVNNFNFGEKYMNLILSSLEEARVDYIELGYIDERNGTERGRTQFINEKVIYNHFLKKKKDGIKYVAMIDYLKYDVMKLEPRNKDGIDGIRLCFHKKDCYNVIPSIKHIISLGYECYVQPMLTLRYSDKELIDFIDTINREISDISGFYVVDSFGEMRANEMKRLIFLVDYHLKPGIALGFHSHNNLQLSYSNAISLIDYQTNRDIMIDSSIMGMGKGAGNLNTELLLEHMNLCCKCKFNINPLIEVIDKVINQLHSEFYWGYAVEYYLSSINHCTPSYASHFYSKHMLPIEQVGELLTLIDEDKKISFDKEYAEQLYRLYNASKTYDDEKILLDLKNKFKGKEVLVIAPGKSINKYREKIDELKEKENILVITLNITSEKSDYIITTRMDAYREAINRKMNIIVPSSLAKVSSSRITVVDYKKWIVVEDDGHTRDSSAVICLNLLGYLNVKKIYLAGLDGFSNDINENYYDPFYRRPVSGFQAHARNNFYKRFINERKGEVEIEFVTPSLYE